MSRKNHKMIDGRLLQTNKKYSQLKMKQKEKIAEWKMMGVRDYVLGLECGNCYPDGRDVMRKTGMLKFLKPGEAVDYHVDIKLYQK